MRNRKLFSLFLLLGIGSIVSAQVPYFSSTLDKGNVSGYTSLSVYTSDCMLESYTYLEYGITDYLSTGMHIGSYGNTVYWGPELRGGYRVNKWFGFSLHAMPSFDLTNKFRFTDATIGLYMSGAILPSRQLFWLTNSYATIYRDGSTDWWQYWYLGGYIPIRNEHALMPMVGCTHSWRFEQHPDLSAGLIYRYKWWNFMVWCSQIISCRPVVKAGIEFDIPTIHKD